jgi:hypothetical protein
MAMLSHSPANSTRAESIAHPAGIWYTKIEICYWNTDCVDEAAGREGKK